ncbi:hypothetical protein CDD82_4892 [Ophiocordyceps australis]|uniref:Uncharacterized protein n=1 Tax=Ophiocordyceps australis TaxID=1399860 RepID=A0A2C5Z585_9HYPO|nr:hypothetical protein CDD82_4892 [Ophiocordyceps australis]
MARHYLVAYLMMAMLATSLMFLFLQDQSSFGHSREESDSSSSKESGIPNQINYVYVVKDPSMEMRFHFSHVLSMYAARHYWRPQKILLHTNAEAGVLSRARAGQSGKWSQLILGLAELEVNRVASPTHADNGQELRHLEHQSDFVRVKGFDFVSPRYVLEKRSNFARALYPVAKKMYDEGVIEMDDLYDGSLRDSEGPPAPAEKQ